MNKNVLLFLILLVTPYVGFSQSVKYKPYNPNNSFWDDGKQFAYELKDSLYVSVGFDSYNNENYILEIIIDNRTDLTVVFDPKEIYLFRYDTNNTLEAQNIYYGSDPNGIMDSLKLQLEKEDNKIKRNNTLSIIAGLAYLVAEIALSGSDASFEWIETVRATHTLTQFGLDVASYHTERDIHDLCIDEQFWNYDAMKKVSIDPKSFKGGRIVIHVPYSPIYKMYIPIDNCIFRYTFKNASETP